MERRSIEWESNSKNAGGAERMEQKAARAEAWQGAQDQDQQDIKKESSIREGQVKLGKGYFVGICLGEVFQANEAEG